MLLRITLRASSLTGLIGDWETTEDESGYTLKNVEELQYDRTLNLVSIEPCTAKREIEPDQNQEKGRVEAE